MGPCGLISAPLGREAEVGSRSSSEVGSQQVHGVGYAFELHQTDVPERDPVLLRGVGYGLADQHLAGPRVVGDARSQVHGLAEVVALLEGTGPVCTPTWAGGNPA